MTLTNGLVVMTPSSIAYSGTSASINADGSVDFSAVTSLSLNGVFTGDYDNYMVAIRGNQNTAATIYCRLRVSGTDNTTTSSYVSQYLLASSTTVQSGRFTDDKARLFGISDATSKYGGNVAYFFGPYLSQPTAFRDVTADASGVSIVDYASTHNQSTSYDGATFYVPGGVTYSGKLTVFGFNQ
jgi:phosphate-selective porin